MNEEKNIKWKEEYRCGIKDIDQQHKDVINIVNKLYSAIEESKSIEKIIELIDNLDSYTTIPIIVDNR